MARDENYEIPPARLGRSSPGPLVIGIVVVAMFVSLAIVKPWTGTSSPDVSTSRAGVRAEASASDPAASVTALDGRLVAPSPEEPSWPADANDADPTRATAAQAKEALLSLATHAGGWGVGNGGFGPRWVRDEPWFDWAAVVPEAVTDGPLRIAMWPRESLCDGYPTINDLPSFVAVTAPADLTPDWRLTGWWTDGYRVAWLDDSIRQISPSGGRGISYLERVDGAPWPPGRYEFHVAAGDRTVALLLCLTRRG